MEIDIEIRRKKFSIEYSKLCRKYKLQMVGVVDLYIDLLNEKEIPLPDRDYENEL